MEHRDALLTIAELAVALAGFASIVSVVAQRTDDVARMADAYRLRLMLEVALRNAAFAVLPLPFLSAFPTDPMLWRSFSGLYLVVALVYGYIRLDDARRAGPRWMSLSMTTLLAITAIVAIGNVLGVAGVHAFSLYAASLLAGLAAAGLSFLAVAKSALGISATLGE